jgi:Notch 1
MKKFSVAVSAAISALTLWSTPASATVTQVDGQIVPQKPDCQAALDRTEPGINAILDAAKVPEVFLPSTAVPVKFFDVEEGAGFENSFGWYNVGDDVLSAAGRTANLHKVMNCSLEPGGSVTVNFATERTAGRYKGGFIAFYLITPEGEPSDNNCGDLGLGTDNKSLFGRIYYTQADLNNDGDFVHHLVYTSPNVANRFYFGFEDLFRGGDNDFEDMLIQVTGLTPPCTPQAEICDGIDNDCDGLIDALDPTLTGVNDACVCDGQALTCVGGARFGECQTGVTVCRTAQIQCQSTVNPSPETCDAKDNNCNNIVDDNPSGTGAACDGGDADSCPEGNIVCIAGGLTCNDNTGANIEICDGMDNDCDGRIDETPSDVGGSCGTDVGQCEPGILVCQNGAKVCTGNVGPTAEICDLLDNDCNGIIDNNPGDVGQVCGQTATGECSLGSTICVLGALVCAGEIGPTTERCNGLDDDCNGVTDNAPVDAGQPCGQSIGACDPGRFVCTAGALVCQGGIGPQAETCNNIDDDCNGIVDDGVPGVGTACGTAGTCTAGINRCINGAIACVGGTTGGTEVCNGLDDDCDGIIDEGDLCNGGVCDTGQCAAPCADGEFPCPLGKVCSATRFCVADPCFNVNCPRGANDELQVCREGTCSAICNGITCTPGTQCRATDGACVPNTCDYLSLCKANELCVNSLCQPDKCVGVSCDNGQFCRDGSCVASCANVYCKTGQACLDGACADSGCDETCRGDLVCNPATRRCDVDPCAGVSCAPNRVCNPANRQCEPDACLGVSCPTGEACKRGQCGLISGNAEVITPGGGGCSGSGESSSAWVVLMAVALLGLRRRGVLLAVAAGAMLSSGSGCKRNDYCLNCELQDGGLGDGGGRPDARPDGPTSECDMGIIKVETCNSVDDDCDGVVDDGFDLMTDERNCGRCGNACNVRGAQTTCMAGACQIVACFPGFTDKNNDLPTGYGNSDGCEYQCFTSNSGIEACDGIDNNCDGVIDDGFNLQTDKLNCGQCGKVCDLFEANTTCSAGGCTFNPATDCHVGFHDRNGDLSDGCEYACSNTNGGVEVCDLIDNNCDGVVDDGFNTQTDARNCGRCGNVCQFPHTIAQCSVGVCSFDPATGCLPGFVDANGRQLDGCEYACTVTNGGVEACDGVDNNCNGTVDENATGTGIGCASTSAPVGACVADGTVVCSQGALVCSGATASALETCDNIDQDCDGRIDNGVVRACYTGAAATEGIGLCHGGSESCMTGAFTGLCVGQVLPTTELCDNRDQDCDNIIDEAVVGGGPLTQSCYSGLAGTAGVGTCIAGKKTCSAGAFGSCIGEIIPTTDVCGDSMDTDCDGLEGATEGCLTVGADQRVDGSTGGSLATAAGAQHSFDVEIASGGATFGTRVYMVWTEVIGNVGEVYFRRSLDGGQTWQDIVNITSNLDDSSVKPLLAVAPGTVDKVYVAFQSVAGGVRDIRVAASSDSGATFGTVSNALDASGDSFHHAIATSSNGSTVSVVWERLDTGTLNRDVIGRTSTDSAANFAAERVVNVGSISNTARFAGRPQVAITSSGRIVWSWREIRGTKATRDIFAATATNAATAIASDLRIDGDTADNRESDFPVMRVAANMVYIAWQDTSTISGGGSDIVLSRSTNAGVTFSAESIIDDPLAEVSSSFTPQLAVDPRTTAATDDVVAIVWEDRREGTQAYASVSLNSGAAFAAAKRVSSVTGDPATGETSVPAIAASGGGILTVSYQNRLTAANARVFVASSIDNGTSWTYSHSRVDSGGGQALSPRVTTVVQTGKAGALTAWSDFRSGTKINGDIYTAATIAP